MKKVIVFDAVGTLLTPKSSVVDIYFDAGQRFGSSLNRSQVKLRFAEMRSKLFHVDAESNHLFNRDLVSSDEIEVQLWERLVSQIFDDIQNTTPLFEYLWQFFAQPDHWTVYPDVEPVLAKLIANDCLLTIGSNFDSRLVKICSSLKLQINPTFIFHSAGIGFRKPDRAFYQSLQINIKNQSPHSTTILMIGDNLENDCLAPKRFGWHSVWLDRSQPTNENSITTLFDLLPLVQEIA